jgi:hypothetical protein
MADFKPPTSFETASEALGEPFNAFPSWLLRVECDRRGKVQMINQAHMQHSDRMLRDILDKMRHDGAVAGWERRNLSPASRAPAAGRCGLSCCGRDRTKINSLCVTRV